MCLRSLEVVTFKQLLWSADVAAIVYCDNVNDDNDDAIGVEDKLVAVFALLAAASHNSEVNLLKRQNKCNY